MTNIPPDSSPHSKTTKAISVFSFPLYIHSQKLRSLHHRIEMALIHLSSSAAICLSPLPCTAKHTIASAPSSRVSSSSGSSSFLVSTNARKPKKNGSAFTVRSSLDTVVPAVGQVTEVNKDTFWPIVEAAGDKTVVLDMYTQWCGPCKVMAPKFQELSQKYSDVIFLKLDCNQDNRIVLVNILGLQKHIYQFQQKHYKIAIGERARDKGGSNFQDSKRQQSCKRSHGGQI
ncbi:hypothetical protein Ddye_004860 [Dipteronia dyeriana]|uniref:Thioredoxin domain-containing protein n=1 Tax=Dipteronia dyeriana TaxID=168575 RepID=A0AAD9XFG0_9ROSI|nr:hypothetical protein Ddye_004860 [Dipteronia dyeriana]